MHSDNVSFQPARSGRPSWIARQLSRWIATTVVVAVSCASASAQGWLSACDTGLGGDCHCAACDAFIRQYGGDVMAPAVPAPGDMGAETGIPSPMVDDGTAAPQAPAPAVGDMASLGAMGSDLGAGYGLASAAPSIIGDFFGGGFQYGVAFNNATVGIAGGDRRFKLSENNSPFPTNRVFFNYHHFHNALTNIQGGQQDLNRYVFGLERAFLQGQYSVELRVPFAGTMDSVQDLSSPVSSTTEFGNMAMAVKKLLYQDNYRAWAIGMGMVFPTGDDSPLLDDGETLLIFGNDAVNLQPYIGYFAAPSPRWFHQFFVQLDFDVRGNDLVIPAGSPLIDSVGTTVERRLQDQSLLMLDYSYGHWLSRNNNARYMRGVAGMVELHYTTTLEDIDTGDINNNPLVVTDVFQPGAFRRDVLNLTGGLYFQLGPLSSLKVAAVVPLRDDIYDKLFDTELGIQFNRRY